MCIYTQLNVNKINSAHSTFRSYLHSIRARTRCTLISRVAYLFQPSWPLRIFLKLTVLIHKNQRFLQIPTRQISPILSLLTIRQAYSSISQKEKLRLLSSAHTSIDSSSSAAAMTVRSKLIPSAIGRTEQTCSHGFPDSHD